MLQIKYVKPLKAHIGDNLKSVLFDPHTVNYSKIADDKTAHTPQGVTS